VLVSCRLSSTGVGFLSILFPPEDSASLTVGLPDRHPGGPDSVGVSVFRTRETRPGWGAFFTPRRRCPPDQRSLSGRRLPLPNGQPYTPLEHPIGGAADNGAYEDSLAFTRPAFPSPATPGWNDSGFGFHPGLRTPRSPTTHARAGTVLRTLDRITPSSSRASNRHDHSQRATSRRTAAPSFTRPLRRPNEDGLSPPLDTHSASWRTAPPRRSRPSGGSRCLPRAGGPWP
jgi:hypothetical protein